MWLDVENSYTSVRRATDAERLWLHRFLTHDRGGDLGEERLYDPRASRFPTGLLAMVERGARDAKIEVEVYDRRVRPADFDPSADLGWLQTRLAKIGGEDRPYQYDAVLAAARAGRGIVRAATGCHPAGTMLLRADGTTVAVEDVREGDRLLGPSGVRTVLRLIRGHGEMVRVVPVKGAAWGANLDHVLTLVHTSTGDVVDVTVREWLGWARSRKHLYKLLRASAVESFPDAEPGDLRVDPYILGVLLGDGCVSKMVRAALPDAEVRAAFEAYAAARGGCVVYERDGTPRVLGRIVFHDRPGNPVLDDLRELGVIGKTAGDKAIPDRYLRAPLAVRLQVLAGLLDTDGSHGTGGFDYISKSRELAEGVAFLARSAGLAAYVVSCEKRSQAGTGGTYWRVSISGECDAIPTRVARKRALPRGQRKSVLRTGFVVEPAEPADFYGFTLDGDGRYLLADFTVTHNSGKGELSCGLAKAIPTRWLYLVHRSNLIEDIAQRWAKRGDGSSPVIARGGPRMQYGDRLTLATFASMAKALESYRARTSEYLAGFGGIIVDEAHTVPAATHAAVAAACTGAYYRIGLSATPLDRADGRSLAALAMLGPVVYSISYRVLVASGLVAEPSVVMVEHRARPVDTDSWAAMYDALVVEDERRNRLVVEMTLAATRPSMVFTERVQHARKLAKMLRAEGLRVEVVTGSTVDRSAVARRLAAREIDTIVTNRVFQEGLDVPEIRAVVLAQGMKAKIMLLQRIGRGMRLEQRDGAIVDSSRAFEVWDVYDVGTPLAAHSKARLDAYRGQGFRVDVRDRI